MVSIMSQAGGEKMLRIINESYNEPDRTERLCRDCCLFSVCLDIKIKARRELAYFHSGGNKILDSRERRLANAAMCHPCPYHYKTGEELRIALDSIIPIRKPENTTA